MATFKINMSDCEEEEGVQIMTIGFGTLAKNDQIVREVEKRLEELIDAGQLCGGSFLKISGPASMQAAMVIAHAVGHLYGYVAAFDRDLKKFIVVVSNGSFYHVGDKID